ncbi:hypothetical protein [Hymenobacter profundi]|uniref:Gingipain domain-containing protein n=1 Tax=Hymenobacter profundi TaxID=1982110 RepID=A0ABS6WZ39_9BACT|nr:hypothetical protein [Hymenobacter profundi]MBW3128866.1 hypothetical protein [Hymenobacter profundi]
MSGDSCHSVNVEASIASFNEGKFVFVAYSHGSPSALVSTADQMGYLNSNNSHLFGCSLVYTNSCYSALELKDSLINSNCYAYVGYKGKVRLPDSVEDEDIFITCENKGLVHFLNTSDTLTESVKLMIDYYWEQYYRYIEEDNFVTAGILRHNVDLLVIHDERSITKHDLYN